MLRITLPIIILLFQQKASGLVGYDCGTNNVSFAVVDISQVDDCVIPDEQIYSSPVEVQLVQLTETMELSTFQCNIKISRTISHCGMHSHSSVVANGVLTYPFSLGKDRCKRAILEGELCLMCGTSQQIVLTNIISGQKLLKPMIFAGNVDTFGKCEGSNYADQFGVWKDVIVQGYIEVMVSIVKADVNLDRHKIHFPGSTSCNLDREQCIDSYGNEYYWDKLQDDVCKSNKHIVLYEGWANMSSEVNNHQKSKYESKVITMLSQDTSFSLQLKKPYSICNMEAYTTEHPKLILILKSGIGFYFKRTSIASNGLDLFSYINSKFVLVEKNTRNNFEALYRAVKLQSCQLAKANLDLLLNVARTSPIEFAFMYMKEPGYTATRLGEVIYVSKCLAVEVKVRQTVACFDELPITYHNKSYFLTPRSRLIQRYGTELTCNNVFAPMYTIDGVWYKFLNRPLENVSPKRLKPTLESTLANWEYKSIINLASSGIYSQSDLDTLRDHLLYGPEKAAVENILVRGSIGQSPDLQGLTPGQLLSEGDISGIADKVTNKIWGWFSIFGNISAGIIGLISIVKIMKWIIDSIINGTLLYELYGFSYHVLGCIFDSVTHCLVYNAVKNHRSKDLNNEHQLEEGKTIPVKKAVNDSSLCIEHLSVESPEHSQLISPSAPQVTLTNVQDKKYTIDGFTCKYVTNRDLRHIPSDNDP